MPALTCRLRSQSPSPVSQLARVLDPLRQSSCRQWPARRLSETEAPAGQVRKPAGAIPASPAARHTRSASAVHPVPVHASATQQAFALRKHILRACPVPMATSATAARKAESTSRTAGMIFAQSRSCCTPPRDRLLCHYCPHIRNLYTVHPSCPAGNVRRSPMPLEPRCRWFVATVHVSHRTPPPVPVPLRRRPHTSTFPCNATFPATQLQGRKTPARRLPNARRRYPRP